MSQNKETFGGAKRRAQESNIADDIAALEASLSFDLEAFDQELGALAKTPQPVVNPKPAVSPAVELQRPSKPDFQTPVPPPPTFRQAVAAQPTPDATAERMPPPRMVMPTRPPAVETPTEPAPVPAAEGGSLLDALRRQAESKQREEQDEVVRRANNNKAIDTALKQVFQYLHDLVLQLNIVKPPVARDYLIQEPVALTQLSWEEGFADFRTQSQSADAVVETVTFNFGLKGKRTLHVTRESHTYERFRTLLFDYGLSFTCEEVRNLRRHVERAEFVIRNELKVNMRWQADFDKGEIVLETRNLERLGTMRYSVRPQNVDHTLLESFGRLILGQPNNFRELLRR